VKLLTVKETAEALSVSPSLVYRLASEGALRCYRIGRGALRFSQEDVQAYLNGCVLEVKLEPRRRPTTHLKHIRI
jgi:excisionase family DNA binding protein